MPEPHTPTTETVRECFLDGAAGEFIPEDFDRWLSAYTTRIREEALREAAKIARTYDDGYGTTAVTIAEAIESEIPEGQN